MTESKATPGSIRAARMIYETHKIESTTMPCLGAPTEQYIQDIAGMIDQETELPYFTAKIEAYVATIDRQAAEIEILWKKTYMQSDLIKGHEEAIQHETARANQFWKYKITIERVLARDPATDDTAICATDLANLRAALAESESESAPKVTVNLPGDITVTLHGDAVAEFREHFSVDPHADAGSHIDIGVVAPAGE